MSAASPATQTPVMTVRRPDFDFSSSSPIWMPAHLEFGYSLNGGSLTLPALEPYLIRVMRQAKSVLGDRRPDLQHEIDLFCAQEAHHYKLHKGFNDHLRAHYDGIEAFEVEIQNDFDRMLREESLEFNLGYAAGFETTGMVMAQIYFEGSRDSRVGADPEIDALWGWHLAEEYEHRCVAFDVFQALCGSWRERVRMFRYQNRHLMGFGQRAARHMREQDEQAGRIDPSPAERRSMKRLDRRQARYGGLRVARALTPWHDPRAHARLASAERFLAGLEWS